MTNACFHDGDVAQSSYTLSFYLQSNPHATHLSFFQVSKILLFSPYFSFFWLLCVLFASFWTFSIICVYKIRFDSLFRLVGFCSFHRNHWSKVRESMGNSSSLLTQYDIEEVQEHSHHLCGSSLHFLFLFCSFCEYLIRKWFLICCFFFWWNLVSQQEIVSLYKRFCQLDRNSKGFISADEFLSVPEFAMNPLSQVDYWIGFKIAKFDFVSSIWAILSFRCWTLHVWFFAAMVLWVFPEAA